MRLCTAPLAQRPRSSSRKTHHWPKRITKASLACPFLKQANPKDPAVLKMLRVVNLLLRTPRPATEPRDGLTRKFHEKYRKNTPRAEILESQENTPKIPKMGIFGTLGVFFRYFRGILGANSGTPEFRAWGYFFGIFRGNSGSGHLGAL